MKKSKIITGVKWTALSSLVIVVVQTLQIIIVSRFLTKEELCIAYDYCNGYLHSDNPLKVESEINFENEWKWVVAIINKVHILLDKHVCYPTNEGNFYFITMENGKGHPSGNVFGII